MIIAKQSTARTMMVGPVLDADGVAVTDCVVGDFEGSVNGADPAALNGSATLTHRGVGFYSLALTATDLATVGQFEVTINDTVNACPMKEITVVEEAVYDALFAASAAGYQVPIWASASSTVSLTATTVAAVTTTATATAVTTVNGLANNVITTASINDGAFTAAKFASGAFDAVWSVAARVLTAATNITSTGGTTVPQTGDSFARIGATGSGLTTLATQASVDAIDDLLDTEIAAILTLIDTEVAAILAKTNSLTFTVAGQVDSNLQSINDTALQGNGSSTPWGPV